MVFHEKIESRNLPGFEECNGDLISTLKVTEGLHFARTMLSMCTVRKFIEKKDRYFFERY